MNFLCCIGGMIVGLSALLCNILDWHLYFFMKRLNSEYGNEFGKPERPFVPPSNPTKHRTAKHGPLVPL